MSPFAVIICVVILSLIGPFVVGQRRSVSVWATMLAVDFVIVTLYAVVRTT